jgi:hypothetical protein
LVLAALALPSAATKTTAARAIGAPEPASVTVPEMVAAKVVALRTSKTPATSAGRRAVLCERCGVFMAELTAAGRKFFSACGDRR